MPVQTNWLQWVTPDLHRHVTGILKACMRNPRLSPVLQDKCSSPQVAQSWRQKSQILLFYIQSDATAVSGVTPDLYWYSWDQSLTHWAKSTNSRPFSSPPCLLHLSLGFLHNPPYQTPGFLSPEILCYSHTSLTERTRSSQRFPLSGWRSLCEAIQTPLVFHLVGDG